MSNIERYNKVIDFWDDVYGFSMKCMKAEALKEAFVETVPLENVITNSAVVTEIDLRTCTINACIFSSKFKFTANKEGTLTAVAGYFDTFFDLDNKVEFSTGPHSTKTHWQQSVFFLGNTVAVKEGEIIEGTISCTRLTKNVRGLSVAITIGKNKYQYYLD